MENSTVRPLILAAAGFVLLLTLAVVWPDPVRWINDQTVEAPIALNDHSFLGREAPAWDMVFWGIAGLYALFLLDGRLETVRSSTGPMVRDLRLFPAVAAARVRRTPLLYLLLGAVLAVLAIAATWRFFDAPLIAEAEAVQSDLTRASIRLTNRLGGGMNPVMIVVFYWLAGLAFSIRRWWLYGIAMSVAAISGGILVQCVKFIVGRARPEVWLGPFHYVDASSSSFPSGHTVGAFAIAGVLLFSSRSTAMRVVAFLLAVAIAASRVLAFRHWPSDVLASSLIGLTFGWFFASVGVEEERSA